jgi:type 2A phosphatase activator TIP41
VGPDYDWTFTTEYKGTISAPVAEGADAAAAVAGSLVETEEKIDLDRLRVPEPMLFFDEVVLFEDELADNGDSFLSVKVVRVQPTVATATGFAPARQLTVCLCVRCVEGDADLLLCPA